MHSFSEEQTLLCDVMSCAVR